MTHIKDHYSFGRIAAPNQWNSVPDEIIANDEPVDYSYDNADEKRALHTLIRNIRLSTYTPDAGRDAWCANAEGDCEDKCLHLIERYRGHALFSSLRLAICELKSTVQHAVLLLYTVDGTKVIDPTLSTLAVDWEKYPVNKWLIRHRNGHLWENFKPPLATESPPTDQ